MMYGLKRFLLAGCLFLAVSGQAVTMEELFIRMPSNVLPTLSLNARQDLVDYYKNNQKALVPSVFEYKASLAVLTENYLQLQTSSVSTIQVKLLQQVDSTVIMVINSAEGPLPDSRVRFFTTNWKPVKDVSVPVILPRHFLTTTQLDAEQVSRFDRICSPFFVRMDANAETPTLRVRAYFGGAIPQDILAPYKGLYTDSLSLSWNGKGFQF